MTCYTADYHGTLTPSNEVEELIWLTYTDRDRRLPGKLVEPAGTFDQVEMYLRVEDLRRQ